MHKGFTLIELMISIFAGIIILGTVMFLFITMNNAWDREFYEQRTNNQLITLSQKITDQLITQKKQDLDLSLLPELPEIKQQTLVFGSEKIISISATILPKNPQYQTYSYHHLFRIRKI